MTTRENVKNIDNIRVLTKLRKDLDVITVYENNTGNQYLAPDFLLTLTYAIQLGMLPEHGVETVRKAVHTARLVFFRDRPSS